MGHRHAALMAALGRAALAAAQQQGGSSSSSGGGGALDGDDLTTIGLAFPAAHAYNEPFFKWVGM